MIDAHLPLIFMVLMALAILAYVILDGYDLGVGVLLNAAPKAERDAMIASIGPFWDANETWLVLGVGILLIAFPKAHGVILTALYIPVALMLVGLMLRGVAFEFRVKAHTDHKDAWDRAFFGGSLLAGLAQGYMLGRFITGFDDSPAAQLFALFIAAALVAGYSLLGAGWLILKSQGALRVRAIAWAQRALWWTGAGIAAVSLATPQVSARIFEKWFAWPNLALLAPIPILTGVTLFACFNALHRLARGRGHDSHPFAGAVALFLLAFIGLAYSLYPYLVMDQITIWEAASATASLRFIFIGVAITLPVIVIYTVWSYRVFWGKSQALSYD